MERIKENILQVKSNIIKSCKKANREDSEVQLIAVSKYQPIEALMEAYEAGCRDFGENKVQELLVKYEQMPEDTRFHMIGHLQRNKVKSIIDKVVMIHSVDTLALAEEISKEALKKNLIVDVLIEVNVAMEDSKFGLSPDKVKDFVKEIAKLPGISVKGLMTIAPFTMNEEENRIYFHKLHQLAVDIKHENIDNVMVDLLSMGMTGDYCIAIEEGASFVRVGTGIFGERS